MASIHYLPAEAEIVVARVTSWAAQGDPISHGPGLDQVDASQLAAHLAYLRHVCAWGPSWYQGAWFDRGRLLGIRPYAWGTPVRGGLAGTRVWVPIVGQEPFRRSKFPESGMGADWPKMLALACENVLKKLADAETGNAAEPGWGSEFPGGAEVVPGGIGLAGIAIIVAGAAVGVIGTAAAWRYLDPETRIETASIAAASRAYEVRLRAQMQSGRELPPSPIEQAQADRVRQAAGKSETNHYLWGGAALAGLGGGLSLASMLRSRLAR
jgi:hypothetical protein